ncbi:MAG TPA: MFS transporter [Phycisphaerales bacterium]|nr:MFS transporter [Phycisphaerales bacterium]
MSSTPPPILPAPISSVIGAPTPARAAWVVPVHIAASSLVQSVWMSVVFITPILAKKHFKAADWQTLVITAAPTVFFTLSIFWNDLFRRRSFAMYMLLFWLVACAPAALIAFADNYTFLVIPYLIMCVGGAGLHPATGDLYRALYPAAIRGRIYSLVWGSSMVIGAAAGWFAGHSLDGHPDAYRVIYPVTAALQLLGAGMFMLLSHASGHSSARVHDASADTRSMWKRVTEPITHAREVLAEDPIFARYEASFMTYGVGWMICYALLPLLVTDKLRLSYESIAESTHVAYWVALAVMIYPAGMLMDRIGAVRTTGLSFLLLTLYPIGLMLSGDARQLLITSVVYGVAHSGANVGWMLGPVSLAPTPEKVPQYVAIHATLVGVRGKVFQFAGMALYWVTGSFATPLAIAALALAWSAVQMWQLDRRMGPRGK